MQPQVGDLVRVGNEEREVVEDVIEPRPGWLRVLTRCADGATQYVDVDKLTVAGRVWTPVLLRHGPWAGWVPFAEGVTSSEVTDKLDRLCMFLDLISDHVPGTTSDPEVCL